MATALTEQDVIPEVFVTSPQTGVIDFRGIRVERVEQTRSLLHRGIARVTRPVVGTQAEFSAQLANAHRLAAALHRRHLEQPFDVVQSSNYHLTGAFVPTVRGRCHIVRISTSRRLYDNEKGLGNALASHAIEIYDARTMRRANAAYAPSRFLADHFRRNYGIDVLVLRPPAQLGATPAQNLPFDLPSRYLIHFGSLGPRKGTDLVASALERVWKVDPSLRMVWVGAINDQALATYRTAWGAQADRVTVLGPLERSLTYGVLQRAIASVLPSTVDNLPNTVIESLVLGVPVIGSNGASIDELVEHGQSGTLIPIGDLTALTYAMLEAWQGRSAWLGSGFRTPPAIRDMLPKRAVSQFLELVADVRDRTRRV